MQNEAVTEYLRVLDEELDSKNDLDLSPTSFNPPKDDESTHSGDTLDTIDSFLANHDYGMHFTLMNRLFTLKTVIELRRKLQQTSIATSPPKSKNKHTRMKNNAICVI